MDEREGVVVAQLPRALYRVRLDSNEDVVAHASGSSRRNFVRLLVGDRVRVARSSRDRGRGRITRRIGD
jgi:translation initiation factor IF-1